MNGSTTGNQIPVRLEDIGTNVEPANIKQDPKMPYITMEDALTTVAARNWATCI